MRFCGLEVLMMRREPSPEDGKLHGLKSGSLFGMREFDEEGETEWHEPGHLLKIANASVEHWIEVYLSVAQRFTKRDSVERRKTVLRRIQVRDYLTIPTLSVMIVAT